MFIEYLPHMACLFGGAIVGFGVCAALTQGKVADLQAQIVYFGKRELNRFSEDVELRAAHTRVTDALSAKTARIRTLTDIARSQQSIKSGRILDVLEG